MARRTKAQIEKDNKEAKVVKGAEAIEAKSTQALGTINRYAGIQISLNPKAGAYFGIGDAGEKCKVWLDKDVWTCTVPDTLSETEAIQLEGALNRGTIVIGKTYIPLLIKEDGIKEQYFKVIQSARGLTDQVKAPFIALVRMKQVGNWTPLEILTYCLDKERTSRARPEWISFIEQAIANYNGPDFLVEDFVGDPDEYEVTIDPNVGIVADSRGDIKKDPLHIEYSDPSLSTIPSQVAEKELNKFLGD